MKVWNKEVLGRIEHSKTTVIKELEAWDLVEEMRELNQEEMITQEAATRKLRDINHIEEVYWRKKSRVVWLRRATKTLIFFIR